VQEHDEERSLHEFLAVYRERERHAEEWRRTMEAKLDRLDARIERMREDLDVRVEKLREGVEGLRRGDKMSGAVGGGAAGAAALMAYVLYEILAR
jgi:hypothetical protein